MKRYFYILATGVFLLAIQACNNTKDVEAELHKAGVYIDEHPELALETLEAIDTYADCYTQCILCYRPIDESSFKEN